MLALHGSLADPVIVHLQHKSISGPESANKAQFRGPPNQGATDEQDIIMAYTTYDRTYAAPARSGLRATLAQRLNQYRAYRRTLSELGQLSDRELSDLGLHRSQIRDTATEAAYGA